ncbi:MAG: DUF6095 family protein [Flavobacteriaceae bacterium]
MASDKKTVFKGIRFLAFALPLIFIGPTIIYSSFKNKEHELYYIILSIGILCCIFGMFFIFKGVKTMVKGLFND